MESAAPDEESADTEPGSDADQSVEGSTPTPTPTPPPPTQAPRAVSLSEELVRQQSDGESPREVEELEICFTTVSSLEGLSSCSRLSSLTLTKTHLSDLSCLPCVSSSLRSLCLSEQNLQSIDPVMSQLHCLEELFLHDNAISKIENLSGLHRLRKLWLYSNRLQRIEGLSGLSSLRELCVQNNGISSLEGVEGLDGLETLSVSQNPIVDVCEIRRVSRMPSLTSLSFSDPYFAPCPLATRPDYRHVVLHNVKSIRELDGVAVGQRDRQQASEAFLKSSAEFHARIDAIKRQHGDLITAAKKHRRALERRLVSIRERTEQSVRALDASVKEAQAKVRQELEGRLKATSERRASLEAALRECQEEYEAEVARIREELRARMSSDDSESRSLEMATAAISEVEAASSGLCARLGEGCPEMTLARSKLSPASVVAAWRVSSPKASKRASAQSPAETLFLVLPPASFSALLRSSLDLSALPMPLNLSSVPPSSETLSKLSPCVVLWLSTRPPRNPSSQWPGVTRVDGDDGVSTCSITSLPSPSSPDQWSATPILAALCAGGQTSSCNAQRRLEHVESLFRGFTDEGTFKKLRDIENRAENEYQTYKEAVLASSGDTSLSSLQRLVSSLQPHSKRHPSTK